MKLLVLSFLLLILFSCEEKTGENEELLTAENVISRYTIKPSERNLLQGNKGGIFIIPKDCFVDSKGNKIDEDVVIEITEAYTIKDMLDLNLETNSPEGLLITGGMINIEASTSSGKKVQVASANPIVFQKNTSLIDTNRYQFFSLSNGEWEKPQSPSQYLTYYPIEYHSTLFVYVDNDNSAPKWEDISFSKTKNKSKKTYNGEVSFRSFMEGPGKYFNGAEPTSIPADVLGKSFLSSKEYEERFCAFPPLDEYFIDIHISYLKYLDKPLWLADSLVLEKVKKELKYYEEKYPDTYDLAKEVCEYKIKILTTFKNQYKTTFPPDMFSSKELESIKKMYEKFAVDEFIQSYSLPFTGWFNIDIYLEEKYKKLQDVKLKIDCNHSSEKVYLILKNEKVALAVTKGEKRGYKCAARMPLVAAYLVAIGEENGKLHFAKKQIQIGQNEVEELELKPSTEAEIAKALDEIEKGYLPKN